MAYRVCYDVPTEKPPSALKTFMLPHPKSKYVIALALVLPTFVTWIYFVALRSAPSAFQQLAYSVGKGMQFGLPIVWVFVTRRRDLRWHRPTARGIGLGLGFGAFIGLAMLVLYSLYLKPSGFFDGPAVSVREKVRGMGLTSTFAYAAVAMFYAIVHSLMEEYYWRWFVFQELKLETRLPTAIAISSVGFMAHHILVLATFFGWQSPATWIFSAGVAVGGAVWAWVYHHSQSLLGPWVSHCLVDAAIFAIGYDLIRETFQ